MAALDASLPQITVTAAEEVVRRDDASAPRRRFIGPMPERLVPTVSPAGGPGSNRWFAFGRAKRTEHDEEAGVRGIIRDNALQFFLGHGGRAEEWDEDRERGVREEMYRRWQQSDWAQARARKREAKSRNKRWIGSSFDVGIFLGVNILEDQKSPGPASKSPSSRHGSSSRFQTAIATLTNATGPDTFVTAPSVALASETDGHGVVSSQRRNTHDRHITRAHDTFQRPDSANSLTPLIQRPDPFLQTAASITVQTGSDGAGPKSGLRPTPTAAQSDAQDVASGSKDKGKGKKVHYSDVPIEDPAPPGEVLARTGSAVEDTSAGAAQQAAEQRPTSDTGKDDVILRDRMMVQISWTDVQDLGPNFDEYKNRVTQRVQYEDWSEYLVVWRKKKIELYNNFRTPGKEWITGHKRLAFVIPLNQKTTPSLYSFSNLSFALVCPSDVTPKHSRTRTRLLFYGSRKGTNIFVFNNKSRTRAVDWIWKLWEYFGGALPTSVEVRCPAIDTRLRIDVPEPNAKNGETPFAFFSPVNTIRICEQVLMKVEDYKELVGRALDDGATLELAWRIDARLDWIWQSHDLLGARREWAVLCGLALKQGGSPAHLELRLRDHRTTRLRLADGTRIDEPPGIEGYLDRIRPNTQTKEALYISVHDGYMFFISPPHANPPAPPGPQAENAHAEDLRAMEAVRGARQILRASRMTDLRNIVAVRRAFQVVVPQHEDVVAETTQWEDTEAFWNNVESYDEDHRDIGGDDGLAQASDKAQMRVWRSFELVLKSGQIVRFEAYSCQAALEWITRLRPLVSYWNKKHQVDAKMEMDVLYTTTGHPRITPQRHLKEYADEVTAAPPNPDSASADLSFFYDWCHMDGCRSIGKCGRLYGKKGLRGQYAHLQLILITGHLVEFQIAPSSLYNRRKRAIHLLDAYVCSGYLAALRLPEGQYNPDSPPLSRRYQDGLESDDLDEDTLFMIWWWSNGNMPESKLPPLAAQRKVSVYRTRSKLERDSWVWAIQVEIEKAVRAERERESKVRETGDLVK